MTYFNTTSESGSKLQKYRVKAQNQDDLVLEFFEKNYPAGWTPSEVHRYALPAAPITSVRRSITTLTEAGKLDKTMNKRKGVYGRPEHIWMPRLRPNPAQGSLF
jgi:hypothetical protein